MDLSKPLDPHADVERAAAIDLVKNDRMEESAARALAHVLAPGLTLRGGELDVTDDAAVIVARRAPGLARRILSRMPATSDAATDAQIDRRATRRLALMGIHDRGAGISPLSDQWAGVHRADLAQRVDAGEDLATVLAEAGDDTEARISVRTAHALRVARERGVL